MSSWNDVPFSDLLVESRDGEWGKGEAEVGYTEAVVIRGTDFSGVNDPSQRLPHRWIKDHLVERKKLRPGDIVFEMAGGTSTQSTGRSALLKPGFFERNSPLPAVCASFSRHLRLDLSRFSPEFVYYLLQSLHRSGYMGVFHIQHTGVARFQYSSFKRHTNLNIPDLSTQRKISAILSAYDDLIEVNKRRITLLEKMAEELYREWFVRMRFPGYQNTHFVKGLPAEWDTKRIRDVVDRRKFGRIYRSTELADEGSVIVIDQSRSDYLGFCDGKAEHEASPDRPILLFGDHSCKMVFMTRPFSLAENVIPFTPKSDMPAYFLFHLIKDLAKTTEYKRHWTDLVNREVLIPQNDIQLKFSGLVKDNHVVRDELVKVNRVLTKTRDLLLPRLISGKLSVEDLDIQFPPSMREDAA